MHEIRLPDPFAIDPFDDGIRALMRPWRLELANAAPRIKIDVTENDGAYAVQAEIPGVRKEDIDVRVDGNVVTLTATTASETQEKDKGRVLRQERQQGYASRSFTLSSPVDESKSEASYKDGILTLKLPKKAAGTTKRLTVA